MISCMTLISTRVASPRMTAFRALVKNCGLFDLGYSGPAYTWRNNHHTATPIYQRLDRCLVNADWLALHPTSKVLNLPIMLSDHAPILFITDCKFIKPLKF